MLKHSPFLNQDDMLDIVMIRQLALATPSGQNASSGGGGGGGGGDMYEAASYVSSKCPPHKMHMEI